MQKEKSITELGIDWLKKVKTKNSDQRYFVDDKSFMGITFVFDVKIWANNRGKLIDLYNSCPLEADIFEVDNKNFILELRNEVKYKPHYFNEQN